MANVKKIPKKEVCENCHEMANFSFSCMRQCERFMAHLKKIAKLKGSPCTDYRCGVPGVNDKNRGLCECCPIREAYAQSLGKSFGSVKCTLGQEHTPYLTARDYDSNGRKRF